MRKGTQNRVAGKDVSYEVWRVWPDNSNEMVIAGVAMSRSIAAKYRDDRNASAEVDPVRGKPKYVVVRITTTYEVVEDDAAAWRSDGFEVRIEKRSCGPWEVDDE